MATKRQIRSGPSKSALQPKPPRSSDWRRNRRNALSHFRAAVHDKAYTEALLGLATAEGEPTPFRVVCTMEDSLEDIRAIVLTLDLMCMGIATDEKDNDSVAFAYITKRLRQAVDDLAERRGELFRMLHPRRAELEAEEAARDAD